MCSSFLGFLQRERQIERQIEREGGGETTLERREAETPERLKKLDMQYRGEVTEPLGRT